MSTKKRTARIAGLLYLLVAMLSFIGIMYSQSQIVVRDDAGITLINILEQEFLFSFGIVCSLISQVAFLLLAVTLERLLAPVNKGLARLMVLMVVIQIPVFFVAESLNVSALMIAKEYLLQAMSIVDRQEVVMLLIKTSDYILMVLEIFWGLWLIPFGMLVYRSGFIPRLLGMLLITGGVGYIVESLCFLLFPDLSSYVESLAMICYSVAELSTILWLLIVGVRETHSIH